MLLRTCRWFEWLRSARGAKRESSTDPFRLVANVKVCPWCPSQVVITLEVTHTLEQHPLSLTCNWAATDCRLTFTISVRPHQALFFSSQPSTFSLNTYFTFSSSPLAHFIWNGGGAFFFLNGFRNSALDLWTRGLTLTIKFKIKLSFRPSLALSNFWRQSGRDISY